MAWILCSSNNFFLSVTLTSKQKAESVKTFKYLNFTPKISEQKHSLPQNYYFLFFAEPGKKINFFKTVFV